MMNETKYISSVEIVKWCNSTVKYIYYIELIIILYISTYIYQIVCILKDIYYLYIHIYIYIYICMDCSCIINIIALTFLLLFLTVLTLTDFYFNAQYDRNEMPPRVPSIFFRSSLFSMFINIIAEISQVHWLIDWLIHLCFLSLSLSLSLYASVYLCVCILVCIMYLPFSAIDNNLPMFGSI